MICRSSSRCQGSPGRSWSSSNQGYQTDLKGAADAFIDSMTGTPSLVSIFSFADDSPAKLAVKSRYYNAVSVQLDQPGQLAALRTALAGIPTVAEVEMSEREGRLTALPRAGASILPAIAELATAQGFKLNELHLESGRLDEVFRSITN